MPQADGSDRLRRSIIDKADAFALSSYDTVTARALSTTKPGRSHHSARVTKTVMFLASLREEVLAANLDLVRRGVVMFTFGTVSGISRKDGMVAINPSGVPYEELT